MKKIGILWLLWGKVCFGAIILTNTQGEYFDVTDNGVLRYVYGQLTVASASATLTIFQPALTTEVAAAVLTGGLANITVNPVTVTKTISEILTDTKLSLSFQVSATPQLSSNYELGLSLLGQFINTNDYSAPNPAQYFMLQMFPLTAGVTQNVYCDVLYKGVTTTKWMLPSQNNFISQGLFLASNWKTPQIIPSTTGASSITLTLQIPGTSFVGLPDGTYQIRIAAIMSEQLLADSVMTPVQFGTIQKLLVTATYDATTSNIAYQQNALVNVTYLTKLLADIGAALP